LNASYDTKMIIPGKRPIALFIALVAAGMAGNYFKFPIFLNIDFLFGSIFAMLIVQYFGLVPGMLAAALISGYTYFLWNHPYAIIIMTAEAAVVGLLMGRRKMGLVLADTLFWLIIGMPLVYLFYHVVMLVPLSNANIIMTKQAMNGIANALVARLIFTGFALRSRSSLMSYREIVYNLLAFFVLCPTLIILAISGRADFKETDLRIRTSLIQDSARVTSTLETWETDRKTTILNLAEMAAAKSPRQMQPHLEQAKKSDVNFLRIGLLNRDATITAYFPVLDELGQSSIGKNYADRPYLPMLKQTLKPMLSEVVMGKVGIPRPIVMMIVPVVIRGEYGGYVAGTLNLGQIQAYLDLSMSRHASFYTLLDKNDNVIMTNRADQAVMSPFVRGRGTVNPVEGGISQWVPALPSHTPPTERWRQSVYVAETPIGSLAAWKLVLEQPVAPFQQSLYDNYTGKLTLLFLILLGSLALAELLSRTIVLTLERLRTLTHELPGRLATEDKQIVWPDSGIQEAKHLINNFREMTNSLSAQFSEVRQINASLEQRVEERTGQLAMTMSELNIILENAPVGILKTIDRKLVWVNRMAGELLLYSKEELEFLSVRKLYASDEAYEKLGHEAYPALVQGLVFETVQELIRKDGVHIIARYIGKALEPPDLSKGTLWLLEDITERKRTEELIRRSLREKEVMLKEIHHRVKNNMQVICSLLNLQAKGIVDSSIRAMFEESRNRVGSMALIHEKLYSSEDLAHIDFKKYLQSLVSGIADFYKRRDVVFCLNMEPLTLDVNVGIPCGLIVNELVSNSLKYAFPDGRKGMVKVGISKDRERNNVLTVSDNGIGFPETVDFRNTTSLGLQLVTVLTGQIHGTMALSKEEGTTFTITFPGEPESKS